MKTTADMIESPFQLFNAFSENDNNKFFGREAETSILYQLTQESNVVLVYGESGTGKTSIVQCGLLNETKHFSWTRISCRRSENINSSFRNKLMENIDPMDLDGANELAVTALLSEVFQHSFQPVLLIFDQFEEVFVYGSETERELFYAEIKAILGSRVPFKIVFIIKEEFIARLTEFEKVIPGLFRKRLRIEVMSKAICRKMILRSFKVFHVGIENDHIPDQIIEIGGLYRKDATIHLPYFQVLLDKLWKEARKRQSGNILVTEAIVAEVRGMGNVLHTFIQDKVDQQEILSNIDAWKFLKLFVPEVGPTRKWVAIHDYTAISPEILQLTAQYFEQNKLLSRIDNNKIATPQVSGPIYELAHESLVPVIAEIDLTKFRTRKVNPTIAGNPYKGLQAYENTKEDIPRFFGRKEVIKFVYEKTRANPLLIIVGNSGAGKSSLIKAGLLPKLISEGYQLLKIVRAGEQPLQTIERALRGLNADRGARKKLLIIDQYEELITRVDQEKTRRDTHQLVFDLVSGNDVRVRGFELKILITIRADFESQFSIMEPLSDYWKNGKYIVPPFSREEIREIIDNPAYEAGLEFSPPSLVDTICEEVYSSQATGLLPLMSFTLSELYKSYKRSNLNDHLLREEAYDELGGVVGGLQSRAERIYDEFRSSQPDDYLVYQNAMKNIILRMVYFSAGELAGQRARASSLVYGRADYDLVVTRVLKVLKESHLIVAGADSEKKDYYEPAHDVLVRSWGKIWQWINEFGKEKFFLRHRLAQAIEDYHKGSRHEKLLWDNSPWLADLEAIANSADNWLNEVEADFVERSLKKHNFIIAEEKELQDKKLKSVKKKVWNRSLWVWILVLALIGFGVAVNLTYSKFQIRKNLAFAALRVSNIDAERDGYLALKTLLKARDIIKTTDSISDDASLRTYEQQALTSINKKVVSIFNKSDNGVRVLGTENASVVRKYFFNHDKRALLVYANRSADQSDLFARPFANLNADWLTSVLYDASGHRLQSWKQACAYQVENTDLVGVVKNGLLTCYRDSIIQPVAWIHPVRLEIPNALKIAAVKYCQAAKTLMVIDIDNKCVIYDALSGIKKGGFSPDYDPKATVFIEQLKSGRYLILKRSRTAIILKSKTAAGYTIEILNQVGSVATKKFEVQDGVLSPDKGMLLIKKDDRWGFFRDNKTTWLDKPMRGAKARFDFNNNLIIYNDRRINLYGSDGRFMETISQDLKRMEVLDFENNKILLERARAGLSILDTMSHNDTIRVFSLKTRNYLIDLSDTSISYATFADRRADSLIIVKSFDQFDLASPVLKVETYRVKGGERLLSFDIYLGLRQAYKILNCSASGKRNKNFNVFLPGREDKIYPADLVFGSTFLGNAYLDKVKVYNIQNPVVTSTNDEKVIEKWVRKLPQNPSDDRRIDSLLNYNKPWFTFFNY